MNNLLNFLIFVLACYGMTQILVYGSIFDKIRPDYKFFHCPMCIGFWVGILIYISMWYIDDSYFLSHITYLKFWARAFVMGCISSGTSYALSSIFGDNGIQLSRR